MERGAGSAGCFLRALSPLRPPPPHTAEVCGAQAARGTLRERESERMGRQRRQGGREGREGRRMGELVEGEASGGRQRREGGTGERDRKGQGEVKDRGGEGEGEGA
eukprot:128227-Rhodomonas_salina.1